MAGSQEAAGSQEEVPSKEIQMAAGSEVEDPSKERLACSEEADGAEEDVPSRVSCSEETDGTEEEVPDRENERVDFSEEADGKEEEVPDRENERVDFSEEADGTEEEVSYREIERVAFSEEADGTEEKDDTDSGEGCMALQNAIESLQEKPSFTDALKLWAIQTLNRTQEIIVHIFHLLDSFKRAIRKKSFDWQSPVKVIFSGETAEDFGGPKRKFFRLLMRDIQQVAGDQGCLIKSIVKLENNCFPFCWQMHGMECNARRARLSCLQ